MTLVALLAATFTLSFQGKIAPVEAGEVVSDSNACLLVQPSRRGHKVTVIRVIWGSGVKPGQRILLKGYAARDYVGGPNEGKESDFMTYVLYERTLIFLQPGPKDFSLGPGERFAELPRIEFGGPRHDCYLNKLGSSERLDVGTVWFDPSMSRSHRGSVSLEEVIRELTRIRASRTGSRALTDSGHAHAPHP